MLCMDDSVLDLKENMVFIRLFWVYREQSMGGEEGRDVVPFSASAGREEP